MFSGTKHNTTLNTQKNVSVNQQRMVLGSSVDDFFLFLNTQNKMNLKEIILFFSNYSQMSLQFINALHPFYKNVLRTVCVDSPAVRRRLVNSKQKIKVVPTVVMLFADGKKNIHFGQELDPLLSFLNKNMETYAVFKAQHASQSNSTNNQSMSFVQSPYLSQQPNALHAQQQSDLHVQSQQQSQQQQQLQMQAQIQAQMQPSALHHSVQSTGHVQSQIHEQQMKQLAQSSIKKPVSGVTPIIIPPKPKKENLTDVILTSQGLRPKPGKGLENVKQSSMPNMDIAGLASIAEEDDEDDEEEEEEEEEEEINVDGAEVLDDDLDEILNVDSTIDPQILQKRETTKDPYGKTESHILKIASDMQSVREQDLKERPKMQIDHSKIKTKRKKNKNNYESV